MKGLMDEKGDPDSEPVPGWWPQSNAWLSAECTLKDVKCLFFSFILFLSLSCPFFILYFLFDLTISALSSARLYQDRL